MYSSSSHGFDIFIQFNIPTPNRYPGLQKHQYFTEHSWRKKKNTLVMRVFQIISFNGQYKHGITTMNILIFLFHQYWVYDKEARRKRMFSIDSNKLVFPWSRSGINSQGQTVSEGLNSDSVLTWVCSLIPVT